MTFKEVLRDWLPHGVIESRRRRHRLQRLGITITGRNLQVVEQAVAQCRFDIWPTRLRAGGWLLVDVGANKGEFIQAVAHLVRPAAVIAMEPLSSCHPCIEEVLRRIPNGRLVRAAVGAENGFIELNRTENSKMASVLSPEAGINEHYSANDFVVRERVSVPLIKLDDVVPKGGCVGLLKIDVQGYEMEVLQGGIRTLSQTQALLIEVNYTPHYSGAVSFEDLHAFISNRGFRLYGISEPYADAVRPLWADAMYVRKSEANHVLIKPTC
jgi:FkbM family methyltransferase